MTSAAAAPPVVSPSTGRRRVVILGSTGSIGTQALEVIAAHPDDFEVVGLAAGGGHPAILAEQAAVYPDAVVAVAAPSGLELPGRRVLAGPGAATELVTAVEADVILNGITGSIGLGPTMAALGAGLTVALAEQGIVGRRGVAGHPSGPARPDRPGGLRALGPGPVFARWSAR